MPEFAAVKKERSLLQDQSLYDRKSASVWYKFLSNLGLNSIANFTRPPISFSFCMRVRTSSNRKHKAFKLLKLGLKTKSYYYMRYVVNVAGITSYLKNIKQHNRISYICFKIVPESDSKNFENIT